jgi:hypothetical protein
MPNSPVRRWHFRKRIEFGIQEHEIKAFFCA